MPEKPRGYRDRIGPWLAKREILKGMGIKSEDVVVLDVGAYKGNYTDYYLRMWPEAEYHLFEPQPKSADHLREHFKDRPNVHVVQAAVADEPCDEAIFYEGGRAGEMSSLYPRPPDAARRYYRHLLEPAPYKVRVCTLDEYVKEAGLKQVHLIKVDIHGAEGPMIEGATKLLRYKRPPILYIEVGFVPRYAGAWPYHKVATELEKRGYTLFDLYGTTRCKVSRQVSYADALFISDRARRQVIDRYPEEWLYKSLAHAMGMS